MAATARDATPYRSRRHDVGGTPPYSSGMLRKYWRQLLEEIEVKGGQVDYRGPPAARKR
jgi:hypothetical protein